MSLQSIDIVMIYVCIYTKYKINTLFSKMYEANTLQIHV